MTTTIGRVTLTSAPYNQSHDGDRLSFSIDVTGYALAVAKVKRQQLLGLVDNDDEPVIPFTWAADPDLDGFYRVVNVSVEPTIVYLLDGTMRCQVTLERVSGGFAKPLFETQILLNVRSNDQAITTVGNVLPLAYIVFPYGETGAGSAYGGPSDPPASTTSASGAVQKWSIGSSLTTAQQVTGSFFAAPASYYNGAAMLEVQIGGTWYPVIGRHIPGGIAGLWRISNGFIRASMSVGTVGALLIEVWNGSAWVSQPLTQATSGRYVGTFQYNASSAYVDPVVIQNGPDLVSVSLASSNGRTATMSVRAGGPVVSLSFVSGHTSSWRLVTPAAVTEITETTVSGSGTDPIGFYTAEASSTRLVVLSPQNGTVDTVNGRYTHVTHITRVLIGATTPVTDGVISWDTFGEIAGIAWIAWTAKRQAVAR